MSTSVFGATLRNSVNGLPATFWYLWAGTLANRLGSFVVPFLAIYLTDQRHLSPAAAGAVVSMYGLGAFFASPTGGFLSDYLGRRTTLLRGLFLSAASMLALGFNPSPALIGLNSLVLGFTSELFRPAVNAVVADVVPPEGRLKAYAALYWAANLGFSIAPVLAGFMASRSFTALFVADAITTLLYALVVVWRIPETRPTSVAAAAHARSSAEGVLARIWERLGFETVVRDGVFLTFVALYLLLSLLFFQNSTTLAMEMRAHGISPAQYGMIIAVNGVLIVLFQPFAAQGLLRFRRSHVLAVAALLTGVGFGLNAWADSVPFYVAGVVIWTFGEILNSPVSAAVVADLSPVHARGRYQGVFSMTLGSAYFIAPAAGSWVLQHHGATTLWLGCLGVGAAVGFGHLVVAAPRRRRMEELRAAGLVAAGGAGE